MKISQMLEREDFYTINEETLKSFFGANDKSREILYIYPRLNAIVSKKPSKKIVEYLLCEYSVRGSRVKQIAVRAYVLCCMKSFGILSSKKCSIPKKNCSDLLIYPCNKKYRIFDFEQNTVAVIGKYGFDNSDLQHEIEFRKRDDLPDFVLGFLSFNENGYKEKIIDGRPLARISENFEMFRCRAYKLLQQYGLSKQKEISSKEYVATLKIEILRLLNQKESNKNKVEKLVKLLTSLIPEEGKVMLTFSHGDLQPGNIWIENGTEKIYIIDWESWGMRSTWYDKATLFQKLRPGDIQEYLSGRELDLESVVVLLEDLVFHLHELNSLPANFGEEQFEKYCDEIIHWLKKGE